MAPRIFYSAAADSNEDNEDTPVGTRPARDDDELLTPVYQYAPNSALFEWDGEVLPMLLLRRRACEGTPAGLDDDVLPTRVFVK
jgi:hypothetical protein